MNPSIWQREDLNFSQDLLPARLVTQEACDRGQMPWMKAADRNQALAKCDPRIKQMKRKRLKVLI
jgi:hypothetical protein